MMKLNKSINVDVYTDKSGQYIIEVCTISDGNKKTYEAWLYRRNYGRKDFMFGAMADSTTYDAFLEMVDYNLPYILIHQRI